MNNSGDIMHLEKTYSDYKAFRSGAEFDLTEICPASEIHDLYNAIDRIYLTLKSFMDANTILGEQNFISAVCSALIKVGSKIYDSLLVRPYTEPFKHAVLMICDLSINYVNLYITEGNPDSSFMMHSRESFIKIKQLYMDIADRIQLNLDAQTLISHMKYIIRSAEEALKTLGMGDSLLSVSNHYLMELQQSLTRDTTDCKIDINKDVNSKEVTDGK